MDNTNRPAFTLDKAEYIAELSTWPRTVLLSELHRLGLKQGSAKLTNAGIAELIWLHTAPTRERSRSAWEAQHGKAAV